MCHIGVNAMAFMNNEGAHVEVTSLTLFEPSLCAGNRPPCRYLSTAFLIDLEVGAPSTQIHVLPAKKHTKIYWYTCDNPTHLLQ